MRDSTRHLTILSALAIVAWAPFLRSGHITDDFIHVGNLNRASAWLLATEPDAFGFFRPTQQLTYWIEHQLSPTRQMLHRLDSAALHMSVVALAYLLANKVLASSRAAFIAALAFVLTPKASMIAVFWVSARSEILMALFGLGALLSWIRWLQRGERWAFAGTVAFYVLAIFSKEAALLWPILFAGLTVYFGRRSVGAVVAVSGFGLGAYLLRSSTGALMPDSASLYNLATPVEVWMKNSVNYFGRAIPAPSIVMATALVASLLGKRGVSAQPRDPPNYLSIWPLIGLSVLWFLTLIVPVAPIAARSEIRVYLAGLGFCFLTGAFAARYERVRGSRNRTNIGLAVCALVLLMYQANRARGLAETLEFSTAFSSAVKSDSTLREHRGAVEMMAANAEVKQLLGDSVGGYFGPVLRMSLGRGDIDGSIAVSTEQTTPQRGTLRLQCEYVNGEVAFRRVDEITFR
ncbi:MAG TPA: hypothetical protein VNJ02_13880 [Vicinamibacterales bacterium]|nr:hypothetical protein [Vicinamibacterales bacterium]